MKAQFLDLQAAADFLGPGAEEVNRYQTEIFDIVRRRGAFGQRIRQVPAPDTPHAFSSKQRSSRRPLRLASWIHAIL